MILKDVSEFKSSPALAARLHELSVHRTYEPGEVIQAENAFIRSIPIVARGAIRVIRTDDDGREILLYYIRAGESCIMSLLGGMHNKKSKVRAEVEELEYVFRLHHRRFEELLGMINEIAFRKVDERLLRLLNKKGELSGSRVLLTTHEQLARELGTSRVVVSRLLKQLEENGIVKLGRNKILLK